MTRIAADTLERVVIHSLPSEADGSHWQSLRLPDEALRDFLLDCRATLALYAGDATVEDCVRLELGELADDEAGERQAEEAMLVANERPLAVAVARWHDPVDNPEEPGPVAMVDIVLGTGGPHVEVVGRFATNDCCDAVEILQAWSGSRRAVTYDTRACGVFAEYVATFYGLGD